jgi:hypothetical protein
MYCVKAFHLRLCIAMEKFWSLRKLVLPKFLKTTGCKLGIAHCVLNILVSQIVLNGSRIVPLIHQLVSTGMSKHVRVN